MKEKPYNHGQTEESFQQYLVAPAQQHTRHGEQNDPQSNSWRKDQPKNDPTIIKTHYKHIYTQYRRDQIYKEKLGGLQERYQQQHTHHRGF